MRRGLTCRAGLRTTTQGKGERGGATGRWSGQKEGKDGWGVGGPWPGSGDPNVCGKDGIAWSHEPMEWNGMDNWLCFFSSPGFRPEGLMPKGWGLGARVSRSCGAMEGVGGIWPVPEPLSCSSLGLWVFLGTTVGETSLGGWIQGFIGAEKCSRRGGG